MRRTRILKPFNDPDYIFALKHAGFRPIAYMEDGEVLLFSSDQI